MAVPLNALSFSSLQTKENPKSIRKNTLIKLSWKIYDWSVDEKDGV